MARPSAAPTRRSLPPGRALAGVGVLIIVMFSWMAITGNWSPKLGLDLQGGTTVTLLPRVADANKSADDIDSSVNQAVEIIRLRVNGSGVAEAEVTKEGTGANSRIVISVPGENQGDLLENVGRTAKLNFRPVVAADNGFVLPSPSPAPSTSASPSGSGSPSASPSSSASATSTPTTTPEASPSATSSPSSSGNGRVAGQGLTTDSSATPTASASPTTSSSPTGSSLLESSAAPSPSESYTPGPYIPPTERQADSAEKLQPVFASLDCYNPKNLEGFEDNPELYLVTCSEDGASKFLLEPATVQGTMVTNAEAQLQPGRADWVVALDFNSTGNTSFAQTTKELSTKQPPQNQFGIVLDGRVVIAPSVSQTITGGAIIEGDYGQKEARELAQVLKYGALPLTFELGEVQTVSPTLGTQQLQAGLLAGAIGLVLVLIYSLLYYRALGLVTFASLVVAGVLTYQFIVFLGVQIGFTLTLAGIAGVIVSIGITADSFIVFFERLRDEVRDGKTLRTAVETGWSRARRTILAADLISLLAAVVLYLVSVGGVKGFAFTLGLATVVDLFVVFLFTKPLVTVLSRTEFYGKGHKWSGLDARHLGARTKTPVEA